MLLRSRNFVLPPLILVLGSCLTAMERPERASEPVLPNLASLSRSAGYIFAGTVQAVERVAPRRSGSVAVMRITFRVDNAIRGVHTGQKLVIREWAGLWTSGERYRPGQRVMLFLYPPSKLGLTSPVGGDRGHFKIDDGGRIVVPRRVLSPPATLPRSGELERNRIPLRDLIHQLRLADEE